jgi:hypothetical protein
LHGLYPVAPSLRAAGFGAFAGTGGDGGAAAAEASGILVFPSQIQIFPNLAKLSQAHQRKSFNFLRRIERFQWVTPTPKPFFSFLASLGEIKSSGRCGLSARVLPAALTDLVARGLEIEAVMGEFIA